VKLAVGGGEDGAEAPSGWWAHVRDEGGGRLGFGNLPAPSGKPETINMFLPD
jgi:hypothetical protein